VAIIADAKSPEFAAYLVDHMAVREVLRAEYNAASKLGLESFHSTMFGGHEFLTAYCKYLFEYVDGERKRLGKRS
jgi:hypothetical protein